MTLRDDIQNAALLRLTTEARIDGTALSEVVELTCSAGLDQINAEATIVVPQRPAMAEETRPVALRAGYNGASAPIHGGEIVGIDWESFAPRVGLRCRDKLARTRLRWGGADRVYSTQDDGAIIQNILEAYGLQAAELAIESSGWTLGTIQDVVLRNGDDGWSLIARIDRLAGYQTFSGTNGVIYRRRVTGAASSTPAFRLGINDILSIRRSRSTTGIVNKVVVRGLTYEGVEVTGEASAPNPYLPDPPGGVADDIQDDLVESDTKAAEIAQREVGDRNRRPEGLELEIIGNPLIQPGMTILVEHPHVETGRALVLVENVRHSIAPGRFTTALRTSGGTLSGYNAAAPIATIDLQLFQEAEDTGSGIVGTIVAIADGSGSFDPDGDETQLSYAWTISAEGGVPSVPTASGPVCRFTLPADVTSVTASLTLTDADGQTGSTTLTKPIVPESLLVEDLSTAEGAIVAYSIDGQQTWRELTLPDGATAECLCPFGPDWGQLWGASDGHVYATLDAGLTLTDLGQPCGTGTAITAVWAHELTTTRLWAANAGGAVAFGQLDLATQAASWQLVGQLGAGPVRELRESVSQFGALAALAGAGYYRSSDGGTTWTLDDSGDTANRLADGFGHNLYGFLNDDQPLRARDGYTVTLPPLDPPVRHIRGLAPGWRLPELYAADDQARLLRGDLGVSGVTLSQVASAPTGINHLQRSGNEDGVVYLAGDDGVLKSLRLDAPWYLRRTGSRRVFMVGYGGAHPLLAGETLIISAPGAGRAYALWTGSSNDSTPEGWQQMGFGDSAWSATVEQTSAVPDDFFVRPSGASWETPEPDNLPAGYEWLYRRSFTLPAGRIRSATLEIQWDDYTMGIYLNGVPMATDPMRPDDSTRPLPLVTVPIDPAVLRPGATNVLAAHIQQTLSRDSTTNIAYRLVIR